MVPIMIILDNEIITHKVDSINFNNYKNVYFIKYRYNNKYYPYQAYRVRIINKFDKVDLNKYSFYLNGIELKNIKVVYENTRFELSYYRVIFENRIEEYDSNHLKKVSNNTSIIEYMKKISSIISLSTITGKKLLSEQMEKVNVDNLDSALANYIKINDNVTRKSKEDCLIFPFGCNSSQYQAIENAIQNKVSVIEGPPGTGKTQTILNIIANIIVRDMNTQVVSNNNTAIENIEEKLKKYNLDFITALLGKSENKESFVENQNSTIPSFKEYENINMNDIAEKIRRNNDIVKRIYDSK